MLPPLDRLSLILGMVPTIPRCAAFAEAPPPYLCQCASLAQRALCFTAPGGLVDGPRHLLRASHAQHCCYWMTPVRRGRSWFDFTSPSPRPPSLMVMAARRPAAEDLEILGVRSRRDRGANSGKSSTVSSPKATDDSSSGNSSTSVVCIKGDPRRRTAAINNARRKEITSQQKSYLWRLKAAGREGMWRRVPNILLEMRNRGVPRNIYIFNTAIAALARCRRPVEAEALLTAMFDKDSVAPDKVSYNSAINGHARCGDLDAAHRLLGLMRARGAASAALRPDVITYNTVADAAAKRGDAAAAARVLAIMVEDGVQPDAITYNACLAACRAKGDLRRAVVLLELMRGDGIAPDQRSYSAIIATAGKCGEWSRALDFMCEMRREGMTPDKVTFNTAIAAVGSNGQWEMAGSLLAEMKANGLQPDPVSYTSVLSACARAGEWREVLRLLRDMPASGVPPNAYSYSVAIDACGKAGRQDEALGLLEEMVNVGVAPDVVAYNSAIDACSVAGDHETALHLLREMKVGAREGANSVPSPDVVSYGGAIAACARAGRADEALELVAELRANEAKAAAAAVRGDGGVHEEAGGRERLSLPLPNLVTYSSALFACLKAGEVARGGELLEEMIGAGIRPNDVHCDTMVAAWAAAGEPEKAVALVKRLRSHGFLPSLATYETLVWGFAQVADWEATVHILASVLGLGLKPSVRSWDAAIAACSQAGHWDRALALLADMRRQGIKPSKVTYTAAVTGLNRPRYADWGPKLENLARMLQQPRSEDDHAATPGESDPSVGMDGGECKGIVTGGGERSGPSPEDYDRTIEALGDAGNAGGAACLLRVMRREGFHASPRAYRSVIYACARVGHLAEAVTLARELESSRTRRKRVGVFSNGVPSPRRRPPLVPDSTDVNASFASDGFSAGTRSTVVEKLGLAPGRFVGDASYQEAQPLLPPARFSSQGGGVNDVEDDGDNSDEREREREFDLDVVYNCIVCNFARAVTPSRGDDNYNCYGKSSCSSGINA